MDNSSKMFQPVECMMVNISESGKRKTEQGIRWLNHRAIA